MIKKENIIKEGELHWNWQGGITEDKIKIRNSEEYKEWRVKCFERDNYTCQITGKKSEGDIVVHHIEPLSTIYNKYGYNKDKIFDINNGITLNKKIHNWLHSIYGKISTKEDFLEFKNSITSGIEVKFDEYAQYSGNFYIEFECNGKPSGLFREEPMHLEYWAHTDGITLFLLNGDDFKATVKALIEKCRANETLTHKGFKVIEAGGNGGRTKGLLIPVKELEKISYLTFNIKDNV